MPFGNGMGPFGQGPRGGRGGFGRGRGRGRMFPGWSLSQNQPQQNFNQPISKEQELEILKQQSQQLKQQSDIVLNRIDELDKMSKQKVSKPTVLKAVIDKTRCTGCSVCVNVCPQGAIRVNDIAKVDAALCTGCSACVRACPNGAIFLRKA